MSKLDYKTITAYHVDSFDLEQFITEVYNLPNRFEATLESSNDTTHEFSVDGDLDDASEGWELIEKGYSNCWELGNVLDKLVVDGHIPAGKWFVRVCW